MVMVVLNLAPLLDSSFYLEVMMHVPKLIIKTVLIGLLPLIIQSYLLTFQLALGIKSSTSILIILTGIILIPLFYINHRKVSKNSMPVAYRFNRINEGHLPYVISLGFLAFFLSLGFSGLLNFVKYDPETAEGLTNLIVNKSLLLTLISVGIMAPLYEEIVFRGAILKNLGEQMPIAIAVIVQAILFSAYHMNVLQAFPTLALGLVTGFAVLYTNSVWSGIIIHMINNILAILISNFTSETATLNAFIFFSLMLVALVAILYTIHKLKTVKSHWHPLPDPMAPDVYIELDELTELDMD